MVIRRFEAENNMDAFDIFEARKEYKRDAFSVELKPYIIDLWEEKPNYGLIDQTGQAVFLSESNLVPLETDDEVVLVVDFVAEAFEDLRRYMRKAATQRKIVNDEIISKMEPKKGWTSVNRLHHILMNFLYEIVAVGHLDRNGRGEQINSFESFVTEFIDGWRAASQVYPFTRSGFITSKYCTPMVSGLAIEIAEEDYSVDSPKQNKVIDHPNFVFYKNAARGFGFRIDKNAPWRLIAHVSSKQMQEYMVKYGIEAKPGSAGDLFELYYYKAHEHDIDIMKSYLIQMYNSYVSSHPFSKVPKSDACGHAKGFKRIKRKPITEEILVHKLTSKYWLKTYATMKFLEGKKNVGDRSVDRKIIKAMRIQKVLDTKAAIRYIVKESN